MPKLYLGLALLLLAAGTDANAQARGGTPDEQKACSRDASRFCRKLLDQGDFAVLACLKENRAKLTSACQQVLTNRGQ